MNIKAWRPRWVGSGVLLGPVILGGCQFSIDFGYSALVGDSVDWRNAMLFLPATIHNSLLPGSLLGGLSIAIWNGWDVRDRMRLRRAMAGVVVALLVVAIEANSRLGIVSRVPPNSISIPVLTFIPWKERLVFMLLATDISLQWVVVLTIVGKLAANRLRREALSSR